MESPSYKDGLFYKSGLQLNMHISKHLTELFAEAEVIIGEYSPRRSSGEYSPIITEPEANNCFSIFTQVYCVFWD